jgi:hypothetical protein
MSGALRDAIGERGREPGAADGTPTAATITQPEANAAP